METPLFTINFANLELGESISMRNPDRGFGPASFGLNLTKEKGTLYFQESATDRSGIEGDAICFAEDPSFLGNDAYVLDDEGKFYTLDGATLTKRQTDAVKTYQLGTSDMLSFMGNTYATSIADVALLGSSDLVSLDEDWWSATRGHGTMQNTFRHPLEVVEDTMYIGDGNFIHTWDGTTSVENAMTLPNGVNITSLRKHPDGRNLLAFCGVTANYSHSRNGGGKVYVIDTINLEFTREIDIEAQVEGTRNVGGVIFATYGAKLGYFTGDGIEWVRDLTDATTYSHQISNIEDTLIIRSGANILAYGNLGKGNVWWNMFRADGTITALGYKGGSVVLVGFPDGSTEKLKEVNVANAGIIGEFDTNRFLPGQNIAIRRIEIDHTRTPVSGLEAFYFRMFDNVGDSILNVLNEYTSTPVSKTRIDCDVFTDDFYAQILPSNGSMGFREIRIYGESIE